MNSTLTQAQVELKARFDELPEEIMDIIVNGTLDATTYGIHETFNLSDEQIRLLENEIIFVLSFFIDRSDFIANIQESLNINNATAQAINQEVQTEIFELVEEYFEVVEGGRRAAANGVRATEIESVIAKKSELASLAQTFAKKEPERLENPAIEELTSNVEPLRTMEGDINRVHGYGVQQAETTEENDTEPDSFTR